MPGHRTDAYANGHLYIYANAYSYGHSDSNSNADSCSNSNTDSCSYSNTDSHGSEPDAYVRAECVPGVDRVFGYRRTADYAAKPDTG